MCKRVFGRSRLRTREEEKETKHNEYYGRREGIVKERNGSDMKGRPCGNAKRACKRCSFLSRKGAEWCEARGVAATKEKGREGQGSMHERCYMAALCGYAQTDMATVLLGKRISYMVI